MDTFSSLQYMPSSLDKDALHSLFLFLDQNPEYHLNDLTNSKLMLHAAARYNSIDDVNELLQRGALIDILDDYGNTALHYAVARGNLKIVSLLVKHGADIAIPNEKGLTPFSIAISKGKPTIAIFLWREITHLNSEPIAIQDTTQKKESFLCAAARQGKCTPDGWRIAQNPTINRSDENDNTALHYAATQGDVEVVKLLIQQGSDIVRHNKKGLTPFGIAVVNSKFKVAKFLLQEITNSENYSIVRQDIAQEKENFLFAAARDNDIELAEWLLTQGTDMNAQDNEGATALRWAISKNHYEMVRFLLEQGACIEPNPNTINAVVDAIKCREETSPNIICALIEACAQPFPREQDLLNAIKNFDLQNLVRKYRETHSQNITPISYINPQHASDAKLDRYLAYITFRADIWIQCIRNLRTISSKVISDFPENHLIDNLFKLEIEFQLRVYLKNYHDTHPGGYHIAIALRRLANNEELEAKMRSWWKTFKSVYDKNTEKHSTSLQHILKLGANEKDLDNFDTRVLCFRGLENTPMDCAKFLQKAWSNILYKYLKDGYAKKLFECLEESLQIQYAFIRNNIVINKMKLLEEEKHQKPWPGESEVPPPTTPSYRP